MQSAAHPKPDRTPEVVPEIQHTVPWRVVSVTALPERRPKVAFVDWPNGADLAPDAMYDAIRQDGRWIVA